MKENARSHYNAAVLSLSFFQYQVLKLEVLGKCLPVAWPVASVVARQCRPSAGSCSKTNISQNFLAAGTAGNSQNFLLGSRRKRQVESSWPINCHHHFRVMSSTDTAGRGASAAVQPPSFAALSSQCICPDHFVNSFFSPPTARIEEYEYVISDQVSDPPPPPPPPPTLPPRVWHDLRPCMLFH